MADPLVIAELDHDTVEWIQKEAERTGMPVEAVARQLIYRGLAAEREEARQERHHDLDVLAGTWSAEEADEFHRAIADLDQIDPSLWR